MPEITYRPAGRGDVELIMQFIRDLAEYERLVGRVVADADVLADWLFEKRVAEVVFAVCDGVEAGFALYFHNFSTFLGRAGIYLEDLYVKPGYRGRGLGLGLMKYLAGPCVQRGWSGRAWTGTSRASASTSPSAPSRRASGRPTDSRARRSARWVRRNKFAAGRPRTGAGEVINSGGRSGARQKRR